MLTRPANFLAVVRRLDAPAGNSKRQTSDARSAVRTAGRLLLGLSRKPTDAELARINLSEPAELNRQLNGLEPDDGITAKSLGHTISRFRLALRLAGIEVADGHGRWPLSPPWRQLLEKVDPKTSDALFAFSAWCSRQGLSPTDVRQSALADYKAELLKDRPLESVMQTVRRVKRTWNQVASDPAFNLAPLDVPGVTVRRHLRHDLPPNLLIEIGQFIDSPIQGQISLKTRRKREYLLRFIASEFWTVVGRAPAQLVELIQGSAPQTLMDRVAARTIRGDGTDYRPAAYELARLLLRVARWTTPRDIKTIDDLRALSLTRAPSNFQLTRAQRDFLRHFCNFENVIRLRNYAINVYGALLAKPTLNHRDYTELTVAFAARLMMTAPLLPAVICSATIGANGNVRELHELTRRVLLCLDRKPGASGGALEYELIGDDLAIYDAYVTCVRAAHPGAATHYLFPGRGKRHKCAAWFSQQIARFLSRPDALGVRINASSFRLVMAFIVLVRDPNALDDARDLLGNTRRASLARVVELVEIWRSEGAFASWPVAGKAGSK